MVSPFRFDPPKLDVSSELAWVISRAFTPAGEGQESGDRFDAQRAIELANTLDLTARIGSRTPYPQLVEELSEEAAGRIIETHRQTAARSLMGQQLCRELAETGCGLDIPLVFLKGAALNLGEKAVCGARRMSDVDVLAPNDCVHRLQEALISSGCRPMDVPESEHQLQLLIHRSGLGVEVHRIIPGVRFDGLESANTTELFRRDLVRPAPGFPEGCYLPVDEVLLAHLLVHGISQHGMAPQAYPMMRMLADIQDIGAGDDEIMAASIWIGRDVSRDEVEAVVDLVWRLESGEDPSKIVEPDDNAGAILRHILAGVLDQGYARSMKFGSLTAKPVDKARFAALAQTLWRAVFLTRGQIDILYGTPRTSLGYWGWRLWRPFDLVLRAVRYGRAWIGHRLRKR